MFEIHFWQGAIGEVDLTDRYKDTISKLLTEPLNHGLHLEKLHDSDLYSVRANDTVRLLLTTHEINGERHVLILKALENHEYEKEKQFIKNSGQRFIQRNEALLTDEALNKHESKFEKIPSPQQKISHNDPLVQMIENRKTSNESAIHFKASHYLDKKYVVFNEAQDKAHHSQMPLILYGIAGSGKSLVCLSLLKNALYRPLGEGDIGRIAYLAPNPNLVKKFHQSFCDALEKLSIPYEAKETHLKVYDKEIHIIDMETLEESVFNRFHKKQVAGSELVGRIQTYLDATQRLKKTKAKTNLKNTKNQKATQTSDLARIYYHELSTLNGLPGDEANRLSLYQTLGKRQSLVSSDERDEVLAIYQVIKNSIQDEELVVDFNLHKVKHQFDEILVDESQMLSLAKIKFLHRASKGQMVLCTDTNQSLHSRINVCELYQSFYAKQFTIHCIDLTYSYRNSQKVSLVANNLLKLKNQIQGASNHHENQSLEPAKNTVGRALYIDEVWVKENELFHNKLKTSAHFAVIIFRDSDLDKAQKMYPSHRIFRSFDVQGLEYEHVILFNPFNEAMIKLFMLNLGDDIKAIQEKVINPNRGYVDHKDKDREIQVEFLKNLFVATTRAKEDLFLWQEGLSRSELAINFIFGNESPYLNKNIKESELLLANETNETDWLVEAKRLMDTDVFANINKAKIILREELKLDDEQIKVFLKTREFPPKRVSSPISKEVHNKNEPILSLTKNISQEEIVSLTTKKENINAKNKVLKKSNKKKKTKNTKTSTVQVEDSDKAPRNVGRFPEIETDFFRSSRKIGSKHAYIAPRKVYKWLEELKKNKVDKTKKMMIKKKENMINDISALLSDGIKSIKSHPTWINEDEDFNLILIEHISPYVYVINKELWCDNELVTKKAVSKQGLLIQHASKRLQRNTNIATTAIIQCGRAIQFLNHLLDYEHTKYLYYNLCKQAIAQDVNNYNHLDKRAKNRREITIVVVIMEPKMIEYIDKEIEYYSDIKDLSRVKNFEERDEIGSTYIKKFIFACERDAYITANKKMTIDIPHSEVICQAIGDSLVDYKELDLSYKSNEKILLMAMIREPELIKYSDESLRNRQSLIDISQTESSQERMMKIISKVPEAIQFANDYFMDEPTEYFDLVEALEEIYPAVYFYARAFLLKYYDNIRIQTERAPEKITSIEEQIYLFYFLCEKFNYDAHFEGGVDEISSALTDVLCSSNIKPISQMINTPSDLMIFFGLVESCGGNIQYDFNRLLSRYLFDDFEEADFYKNLFDIFISKEVLAKVFKSGNDLFNFIETMINSHSIFKPRIFTKLISSIEQMCFDSLSLSRLDFESLLSCYFLLAKNKDEDISMIDKILFSYDEKYLDEENNDQSWFINNEDREYPKVLALDFLKKVAPITLQRFYEGEVLNYEDFSLMISKGEPLLPECPELSGFVTNCYEAFCQKLNVNPIYTHRVAASL